MHGKEEVHLFSLRRLQKIIKTQRQNPLDGIEQKLLAEEVGLLVSNAYHLGLWQYLQVYETINLGFKLRLTCHTIHVFNYLNDTPIR